MFYPFYRNDNKASVELSGLQKETIRRLKNKINKGDYKLVLNSCLCGNDTTNTDTVISEKDRYGLSVEQILCNICGLMRSSHVFDNYSNIEFYKNEYRDMYMGVIPTPEALFYDQLKRGTELLSSFKKAANINDVNSVFEVGCASGGIVYPFSEYAKCSGSDYDANYLNYGLKKGLDLKYGDYNEVLINESVDLIILSHVMEHFVDPIGEMNRIIRKLKSNGYLIVEVPSLLNIIKIYSSPLQYFQNAHAYSYCSKYLNVFFKKLNLSVISGNEKSVFVLQKPNGWEKTYDNYIFDDTLEYLARDIKKYLFVARTVGMLRTYKQKIKAQFRSI